MQKQSVLVAAATIESQWSLKGGDDNDRSGVSGLVKDEPDGNHEVMDERHPTRTYKLMHS